MKKSKYTFQNDRYITRGVEKSIYSEIQILIWLFIDNQVKEGLMMDYLQIFTFRKKDNDKFLIVCAQEKPRRNTEHEALWFPEYQSLLSMKVYVIDDVTHSTMLLAEEY